MPDHTDYYIRSIQNINPGSFNIFFVVPINSAPPHGLRYVLHGNVRWKRPHELLRMPHAERPSYAESAP
eukprot:4028047-Pleurochrysis_carterae.AAC.1